MHRFLTLAICAAFVASSAALAEEAPAPTGDPEAIALDQLRHSATYRKGLDEALEALERAYDIGAIEGASQYGDLNDYYLAQAISRGCVQGAKLKAKPVSNCPKEMEGNPPILSDEFPAEQKRALAPAQSAVNPDAASEVLDAMYRRGYAHGLIYSWRTHNKNATVGTLLLQGVRGVHRKPQGRKGLCRWSRGVDRRSEGQNSQRSETPQHPDSDAQPPADAVVSRLSPWCAG